MPFDDDNRGEPLITHHVELVPSDGIERAAMADFCKSLSPEDWIALEQLGPRVKNALLKQTIAIALKWRKRRNGRRPRVGPEREDFLKAGE
ncbi:MAG TPA: hypothetical protein VFK05_12520 [Polyangiaceae bacterium]|nr:hypothetical protein [Polyangiaceae bacterium]